MCPNPFPKGIGSGVGAVRAARTILTPDLIAAYRAYRARLGSDERAARHAESHAGRLSSVAPGVAECRVCRRLLVTSASRVRLMISKLLPVVCETCILFL